MARFSLWLSVLVLIIVVFCVGCKERGDSRLVVVSSPGGASPGGVFIEVPADFSSIQDAIDSANSGDTVLVSANWYAEDITLKEGVNLWGDPVGTSVFGKITAVGISSRTTIHGLRIEYSDMILDGSTPIIEYCTFRSGTLRIHGGSSPIVQNSTFDSFWGSSWNNRNSSAIQVISGRATIKRSIFEFYPVALESKLSLGTSAGSFEECLFSKNGVNVVGTWSGTPQEANPFHTVREWGEYYLDEGSPGALANREYIGAWRAVDFNARPSLSITQLGGAPSNGQTNVLEFKVSAVGTSGSFVGIYALKLRVAASQSTNYEVDWDVSNNGALIGRNKQPIVDGEEVLIYLRLMVYASSVEEVSLSVDLSHLQASGDYFEVKLEAVLWDDGGKAQNFNGQGLGATLPTLGGRFVVP